METLLQKFNNNFIGGNISIDNLNEFSQETKIAVKKIVKHLGLKIENNKITNNIKCNDDDITSITFTYKEQIRYDKINRTQKKLIEYINMYINIYNAINNMISQEDNHKLISETEFDVNIDDENFNEKATEYETDINKTSNLLLEKLKKLNNSIDNLIS